jgi:hypothetical protein
MLYTTSQDRPRMRNGTERPLECPWKLVSGRHCGASATDNATFEPGSRVEPGRGDWPTTVPVADPGAGTALSRVPSFTCASEARAAPLERPISCGTLTGAGPALTTTRTEAASATRRPGPGLWASTVPRAAAL